MGRQILKSRWLVLLRASVFLALPLGTLEFAFAQEVGRTTDGTCYVDAKPVPCESPSDNARPAPRIRPWHPPQDSRPTIDSERIRRQEQEQAERARIQQNRIWLNDNLTQASRRLPYKRASILEPPTMTPVLIGRRRQELLDSTSSPTFVNTLRNHARQELYWFSLNQYDVMTTAFWAALDPTGLPSPVESVVFEAREHLTKYLQLVRELESITHTSEIARRRYEERVKNLMIARAGPYSVRISDGTATTDIYPDTSEFGPWSEDELIRKGRKCIFDNLLKLHCQ